MHLPNSGRETRKDMRKYGNKKRRMSKLRKKQEKAKWLLDLEQLAKPEWQQLLLNPEGGHRLSHLLTEELSHDKVSMLGSDEYRVWELIGLYFRSQQRWHDAIAIYLAMYYHFIRYQLNSSTRVHKGMPLAVCRRAI